MGIVLDGAPSIHAIADGVWTVDVGVKRWPLRHLPWRMTVMDSASGAILHSPVPLDDDTWDRLQSQVSSISHVVAPNEAHHLALEGVLDRCTAAGMTPQIWLAPRLAEKLAWLKEKAAAANAKTFAGNSGTLVPGLDWVHLAGVPGLNEVVFFHAATKTLVVTDAVVNVCDHPNLATRTVFSLIGAYGGPKQPILWRKRATDRSALAAAVDTVLEWPFERVICAHGAVIESDVHATVERVFAWARPRGDEETA